MIELLNPTAHMILTGCGVNSWRYFVRHGDIYIGMVSKPDVFDSLINFDRERYAEIDWPNPLPDREVPENLMFPLQTQWGKTGCCGISWPTAGGCLKPQAPTTRLIGIWKEKPGCT